MSSLHHRGRPVLGKLRVFPERLVKLRDGDYFVGDLADALGVTKKTVYDWLRVIYGLEYANLSRPLKISKQKILGWLQDQKRIAEDPKSRRMVGGFDG